MDHVEIDIVELQLPEAGVEGAADRAGTELIVPDLGGDEELVARDARGSDRSPDGVFVLVHGGSVEMPIAERQRAFDDRLGADAWHAERTEAEPRNGDTLGLNGLQWNFPCFLGGHHGSVRPRLSMKRRPARGRFFSMVSTTPGMSLRRRGTRGLPISLHAPNGLLNQKKNPPPPPPPPPPPLSISASR